MKWARDTETGRVVTLPQLYRLREDEIAAVFHLPKSLESIKEILNRGVRCLTCENPVHVHGSNRLGGFILAGRRLTREADTFLERVGFSHYAPSNPRNDGLKPVRECSLYFPNDPRLADLMKNKPRDPRVAELVRSVLTLRENQCLNRPLLWALHRAAAQRWPTGAERQNYLDLTENELMRHEVLASHPYILPYILVRFVPYFERQGKRGPYRVRFEEHGLQELLYKDINGADRVAMVPEYLTMKVKSRGRWVDMQWDKRPFPLSETAAFALAEKEWERSSQEDRQGQPHLPERKLQTRILSVPVAVPATHVVKTVSLPLPRV